jgi:hypothetical protein
VSVASSRLYAARKTMDHNPMNNLELLFRFSRRHGVCRLKSRHWALSEKTELNRGEVVRSLADEKSIPLFHQFAGGDPPDSDDVHLVSAVTASDRGSSVRTRHRYLRRDCAFLAEPVRSNVRRGNPETAYSATVIFELALAPGRGFVRINGETHYLVAQF